MFLVKSQKDKMNAVTAKFCLTTSVILCAIQYIWAGQNRYVPTFRFLLGGLRFLNVMPLSSSNAVASRSSSGCSFGRSPSPMNSIQVLPTRVGSEYIDTPGYRKIIIIRYTECIQADGTLMQ
jgi:hypothetical protein